MPMVIFHNFNLIISVLKHAQELVNSLDLIFRIFCLLAYVGWLVGSAWNEFSFALAQSFESWLRQRPYQKELSGAKRP